MSADTAEGEFRVPDADTDGEAADPTMTGPDSGTGTGDGPRAARPRPEVDTTRTPGTVVAAVAFGVVAAPLLGVYAVLFLSRWFLQPGVTPDITGSWTGEGLSGIVAAVLALALLVVVARAAGGRGLPVFVGAQVLVVAASVYLLLDREAGGRAISVTVGVVALAAAVLAVVPTSRRWFAAHAAERA